MFQTQHTRGMSDSVSPAGGFPFHFITRYITVTCTGDYRRGFGLVIGCIAPYTFTQLGSTDNYSAIAILHTH
jgi:hypothetical protein